MIGKLTHRLRNSLIIYSYDNEWFGVLKSWDIGSSYVRNTDIPGMIKWLEKIFGEFKINDVNFIKEKEKELRSDILNEVLWKIKAHKFYNNNLEVIKTDDIEDIINYEIKERCSK